MRIVGLYGRGDCGKSETLGIYLRSMVHGIDLSKAEGIFGGNKDLRESINSNGAIVDICPSGDTEKIVKDNIDFIKQNPCDIVFTATRSWGKGCEALKTYAKSIKAELVWIKKVYNDDLESDGQKEANKKFAENLFDVI